MHTHIQRYVDILLWRDGNSHHIELVVVLTCLNVILWALQSPLQAAPGSASQLVRSQSTIWPVHSQPLCPSQDSDIFSWMSALQSQMWLGIKASQTPHWRKKFRSEDQEDPGGPVMKSGQFNGSLFIFTLMETLTHNDTNLYYTALLYCSQTAKPRRLSLHLCNGCYLNCSKVKY